MIIFNIISDLLLQFAVDLSMGDLMKLFRLGTGGEGGLCGVAIMAYHGDLGGMGGKKAMVDGVRRSSSILLFLPIPYRFLFCRCC